MLFLSMGKLRHEALWGVWFRNAAGQLPADCAASAKCSSGGTPQLDSLLTDFIGSEKGAFHTPLLAQKSHSILTLQSADSIYLRLTINKAWISSVSEHEAMHK